ncbi:glycerophosphodiester phosphodiesterase [Spiractinospora alimapuensis]|uniref:glycerophosphodiester phosphodiesterase family protein n=1 Tax=Spiractinospora alimapuensis TaxID=2820884 RepID=UPI001F2920FC|nr:glycerophosphodiester phosphodiesterase family protein [Spiractinospora alimapuensis]QVQ52192.1 glycerophosphodiester phosphodiesterase [Spiractinospora alimapuensis]
MTMFRRILALTGAIIMIVAGQSATAHAQPRQDFDLQAHRGGVGLVVESTVPAFANALRLGVSTLELDIQITEDGEAVVTHDRRISSHNCQDTEPAFPDDPQYPYVGSFIKDLTLEQVRTLDCGSQRHPDHPNQEVLPGERMALLSEVFDLVHRYRAYGVTLNIETKFEAGAPEETAPREEFVDVVLDEIRQARMVRQVTIQSFDWGALMMMREREPRLPIVALTNHDFLEVGEPGASPWLGGIDIDDFDGDPLLAIDSFDADAFSPVHGFPQHGTVDDPDYEPYVTPEMVDQAHELGIDVIPWTINDRPTMQSLIDAGVDGMITDYPDQLREVMAENGFRLPKQYRERGRD